MTRPILYDYYRSSAAYRVRIGLNLNVLDADQTPRVMSLAEALRAFLDHRLVVLERRTRHRIAQIERNRCSALRAPIRYGDDGSPARAFEVGGFGEEPGPAPRRRAAAPQVP